MFSPITRTLHFPIEFNICLLLVQSGLWFARGSPPRNPHRAECRREDLLQDLDVMLLLKTLWSFFLNIFHGPGPKNTGKAGIVAFRIRLHARSGLALQVFFRPSMAFELRKGNALPGCRREEDTQRGMRMTSF